MSRTKLLLNVVSDLKALADSIQLVAEAEMEPAEASLPEMPSPKKESAAKAITLEEVRAVLAEKSHDGFTAEVRALLEKHGASKLSEIDPSKYAALLKGAEGLK